MSCNLVRTSGSERASCEFLKTRLSVLTFGVIERHRVSRNIVVSIVEVITKEDTDLYKRTRGEMTKVRRGRYETKFWIWSKRRTIEHVGFDRKLLLKCIIKYMSRECEQTT